jgi:predicted enzyme related to lactoylglutathione lyase
MSTHQIVHVELPSHDWQAAGEFYSRLFGWTIRPVPGMNYATFDTGDGRGGGFPVIDDEMVSPGAVLIYVDTDDIEASLARAEALGGKTVVPKTTIPGIGWFGIFQDPSGNRIALFTGPGQSTA